MTLILSLVNPHFVVQVADRKLTDLVTGGTLSLNTNKTVLFCNRMAFGFTGIAQIADTNGELVATDMWLANLLQSLPKDCSSSQAVYAIQDNAAVAVAATKAARRSYLRLAFCGTGWVKQKTDKDFEPTICRISNFHDCYGQVLDEPRNEFSLAQSMLRPPDGGAFMPTGAQLTHPQNSALRRELDKCQSRGLGPWSVIRVMVKFIREIASRKSGIGKDLLTSMIPRGTAGINAAVLINEQTGAGFVPYANCKHAHAEAMLPQNRMQFRFFRESSRSSVEYGPTMVWPGRYLCTDLTTD